MLDVRCWMFLVLLARRRLRHVSIRNRFRRRKPPRHSTRRLADQRGLAELSGNESSRRRHGRGARGILNALTLVAFYYQPGPGRGAGAMGVGAGGRNHGGRTPESVRVRDAGIRLADSRQFQSLAGAGDFGRADRDRRQTGQAHRPGGASFRGRPLEFCLRRLADAQPRARRVAESLRRARNRVAACPAGIGRKAMSSVCWKASLPPAPFPVMKSRRPASRWIPRGWRGRTPPAS